MEQGAAGLGATLESVKNYVEVLSSVLSQDAHYTAGLRAGFDANKYLEDGMPYKKLTDGNNTYLGVSFSVILELVILDLLILKCKQ